MLGRTGKALPSALATPLPAAFAAFAAFPPPALAPPSGAPRVVLRPPATRLGPRAAPARAPPAPAAQWRPGAVSLLPAPGVP